MHSLAHIHLALAHERGIEHRARERRTTTLTVTETSAKLEPVTTDPFLDGLDDATCRDGAITDARRPRLGARPTALSVTRTCAGESAARHCYGEATPSRTHRTSQGRAALILSTTPSHRSQPSSNATGRRAVTAVACRWAADRRHAETRAHRTTRVPSLHASTPFAGDDPNTRPRN